MELAMNFEPIGIIKTTATEPVDENWGHIVSEIHLAEPLTPGLRGLEQFSHLIVLRVNFRHSRHFRHFRHFLW